jgi:Ni,Fe-hydrogenase III large subunit
MTILFYKNTANLNQILLKSWKQRIIWNRILKISKLTPSKFHESSQIGPSIPVSGLKTKTFPSELTFPPINWTKIWEKFILK